MLMMILAGVVACAQRADQISVGYTDVSKVMMLHPTMALYKIQEGRFVPAALKNASETVSSDKLKDLEDKRSGLLAEREKLDKQLDKADSEFSTSLATLNAGYNAKNPAPTSDDAKDKYNREKNALETKFWEDRRGIQQKISHIDDSLLKLNRENDLMHLTSHEETARVFKIMLDDVYEGVAAVAEHYKVSFVFNSSFSVDRMPSDTSYTPVNPMGSFFNRKFDRDAREMLLEHEDDGGAPLFMTLEYWCTSQRWAFRTVTDPRLDKMILKGGLDMTPAVVDYVYQKHNIPASHRDAIREFLKIQAE